jgi:hypothetical protein
MSKATISGDVKTFDLGPGRLKLNGVDIGFTMGGVEVSAKYMKGDLTADYFGKVAVDRVNIGSEFTIKTKLAQITAESFKKAFPYASIVGTTVKTVLFGNNVGEHDIDIAAPLVFHPVNRLETDLTHDWTFHLVLANGESAIKYDAENQISLDVTFQVYPDLSKPDKSMWAIYGDPSQGAVSASAGAPVFVGAGNGTLDTIVLNSAKAVTETVTATCIATALNGGIFEVIGSVSGSMGNARVSNTFYSDTANPPQSKIQFMIHDGTADFALGDSFTIAVTAANYT